VRLLDLGAHRLKDLQQPSQLFQLVMAGLPTDFPPLKTLDVSPNNLPVQPTPFIGREKEVAAVAALLRREGVHLVTLTGPGGTGKTRLGLQVAAELSDRFADGVFLVNLAPLSDPELVIPAALQVAELLAACPKLKILVTSRMVLHVRAEQEFAVPPLTLPDPKHLPDLVVLAQYEAVALFIQRARAVKCDFQVTNVTAPAIAEICVRLDGLPLAIELAAARIKLFPPPALLARLEREHDNLRAALAWSLEPVPGEEAGQRMEMALRLGGSTAPLLVLARTFQ
jgi:predicted ATPase